MVGGKTPRTLESDVSPVLDSGARQVVAATYNTQAPRRPRQERTPLMPRWIIRMSAVSLPFLLVHVAAFAQATAPVDPSKGAQLPIPSGRTVISFAKGCSAMVRVASVGKEDIAKSRWLGACRFGLAHGSGLIEANGKYRRVQAVYGLIPPEPSEISIWFEDSADPDHVIGILVEPLTDDSTHKLLEGGAVQLAFRREYRGAVSETTIVSAGSVPCPEGNLNKFQVDGVRPSTLDLKQVDHWCNGSTWARGSGRAHFVLVVHFTRSNGVDTTSAPGELKFCPTPTHTYMCPELVQPNVDAMRNEIRSLGQKAEAAFALETRDITGRFAPLDVASHKRILALTSALAASYVPRHAPAIAMPVKSASTNGKRK
jgi:hypothetical protein